MNNNYLIDTTFLTLLDKEKIKIHYIKLIILDMQEQPVQEIQGVVNSGTLNISGSSSIRRTISLSMTTMATELIQLTNIDNLISLNKKIKVEIGYQNNLKKYSHYGDIVWFKCGIFVIEKASINQDTNGFSISISGKDKMSLLDGTNGGVLPASITFHEKYEIDKNGLITVSQPTIYDIIYETVTQFGKELANNIFINELDTTAKLLIKYTGDKTIWFPSNSDHKHFIITDTLPDNLKDSYQKAYYYGQDIGYMETPMTYPGELVKSAGETVTSLLDSIISALGNIYEYYYDVDGHFIFQKIKDYTNTSYTKLGEIQDEDYVKHFSDSKYYYSLIDKETVISIGSNPDYSNIKNDFVVWGNRTTSNNQTIGIRYHLAIDSKPILDLCTKYMYIYWNEEAKKVTQCIYTQTPKEDAVVIDWRAEAPYSSLKQSCWVLVGNPCEEWREELYRQAFDANLVGLIAHDYQEELLAEWRNLFDTSHENWKDTNGWNPQVNNEPNALNYWLEFIDSSGKLGQYSIASIGKRSKIIKNDKISTIFNLYVPDVIFQENIYANDPEGLQAFIDRQEAKFQDYCLFQPHQMSYFSASSTGISAFDAIRELMYQHLVYNVSINITCFPKFYLEPNNLIQVQDYDTGIIGEFVIKDMSLPLDHSGTMSITANEALIKI